MTAGRDVDALYEQRVRDKARQVRNDVRLADADISIVRTSPICGSSLALDTRCDGDRVIALGYRARACTLGMASTAIVVDAARGATFSEISAVGRQLKDLLDGTEVRFPEAWQELDMFVAARAFRSRHGSIMLPFDILDEAARRLAARG
ncbi:MAG: iron-sulfur cluster assembly scaffold protein [Proteobacteria bacterium]|nr:iron-sulfur cluster assembly scaffold protein [Pseudomonadota bacterium]MBS0270368.1 iron-sulfur cluster assembly scaffold protein [Pseudomonadota bacterium]